MNYFMIYLITRCSSIQETCFLLAFLFGIVFVISYVVFLITPMMIADYQDRHDDIGLKSIKDLSGKFEKIWKVSLIILILSMCGNILIPTTKEAAFIYVIPTIANNEPLQSECKDLYNMSKLYLKEQLEIKKDKK